VATESETLKERVAREMREAMKGREKVRLSALRLLSASIKNREVELGHPLSDAEVEDMARREVKRRREAIDAYDKAGRPDRSAQEREEQTVLEAYLPSALSEQEVSALIDEALGATGASGPGDLGKVMGYVMTKAGGRVDGRVVQQLVRARLGG